MVTTYIYHDPFGPKPTRLYEAIDIDDCHGREGGVSVSQQVMPTPSLYVPTSMEDTPL